MKPRLAFKSAGASFSDNLRTGEFESFSDENFNLKFKRTDTTMTIDITAKDRKSMVKHLIEFVDKEISDLKDEMWEAELEDKII